MFRLRAAVDDFGDVAVFLGDGIEIRIVGAAEPVRLRRVTSFHGGVQWTLGDGTVVAAGTEIASGGAAPLRVAEPLDPASAALPLEVARGARLVGFDAGVRRALVLPPGQGGAATIGRQRGAAVALPVLVHDVVLHFDPDPEPALVCSSVGGVRTGGGDPAPRVRVPLPLTVRIDVASGAIPARRAPWTIGLFPA